ncbi:Protein of unknown function [Lachnospiraceae bacterium XBB1006]|nr:Protein of unknown function [Lachnospiraceae bacterium XBB1006]
MREQYMKQLQEALQHVSPEIEQEILEDFQAHFDMGLEEGKTEDALAEELGDPKELAKQLEEEYGRFEEPAVRDRVADDEAHSGEDGTYFYENTKGEIRVLDLDMVIADIKIVPSKDGVFRARYESSVSESRLNKRIQYSIQVCGNTFVAKEKANNVPHRCWAHLTVEVPGVFFDMDVKAVSGDILATGIDVEKRISMVTVSGDMEIADFSGEQMRCKSVSGDIQCTGGKVVAYSGETVSGDIAVANLECDHLECKSVSGDMKFAMGETQGMSIVVESISGDVDMPCKEKVSGHFGKRKYRSVIGDGKGQGKLKTVSGDITVTE